MYQTMDRTKFESTFLSLDREGILVIQYIMARGKYYPSAQLFAKSLIKLQQTLLPERQNYY